MLCRKLSWFMLNTGLANPSRNCPSIKMAADQGNGPNARGVQRRAIPVNTCAPMHAGPTPKRRAAGPAAKEPRRAPGPPKANIAPSKAGPIFSSWLT